MRQAASDARTFEEALRDAQRFHESEVARLEAEIAATQRRVQVLQQEGRYATERHEHRVQSLVRCTALSFGVTNSLTVQHASLLVCLWRWSNHKPRLRASVTYQRLNVQVLQAMQPGTMFFKAVMTEPVPLSCRRRRRSGLSRRRWSRRRCG